MDILSFLEGKVMYLSVFLIVLLLIIIILFVIQKRLKYQVSLKEKIMQKGSFIQKEVEEIKTSDNFPVATNKVTYRVFANPKEVKDIKETSLKISQALDIKEASVSAKLNLNLFWVSIAEFLACLILLTVSLLGI